MQLKNQLSRLKNNYWINKGSLVFLTRISETIIGFAIYMILIRILHKEQFGIWILYITFITFIEGFRTAFIYIPLVRSYFASSPYDQKSFLSASILINATFTSVLAISFFLTKSAITTFWEIKEFEQIVYFLCLSIIISFFFSTSQFYAELKFRYKSFLIGIAGQKITFLFSILVLVLFQELIVLTDIIIVHLISTATGTILFFLSSKLGFRHLNRLKGSQIKELLQYGKYTILTNISAQLNANIDTWSLGKIINPIAIAAYNPALKISSLGSVPLNSISQIYYPKIAKEINHEDNKNLTVVYEKILAITLLYTIPVALFGIVYSTELVSIIGGREYLESADIVKISILNIIFIPFNRQLGTTLNACGKASINLFLIICNAIFNLILNIVFINKFGIIGAAIGTLLANVSIFLLVQILSYKYFGIHPLSIFNRMIIIVKSILLKNGQ